MENAINTYLNLNQSYKDVYINNNSYILSKDIGMDDLFWNIRSDTDVILNNLHVSPSKCGYKYWVDAVFLFLISEQRSVSVCKFIYPNIAKKYNSTSMAVEKAMRTCFEDVLYNISKEKDNYICNYFRKCLVYPHNNDILCRIVDLLASKRFQQIKHEVQL